MANMSGEGTMTATAYVGYPNGHDWNVHWLKTTKYLVRLREVYQADPVNNIDLMALVDAFMIACTHMWDAFKNDPGLPSIKQTDVDAAMAGDQHLRLCRDYANTAKHLKRSKPTEIVASVLEAGSKGTGNFVTIGFGPARDPRGSTIGALELAKAGYSAWQAFIRTHDIQEQTALITPLLDQLPN